MENGFLIKQLINLSGSILSYKKHIAFVLIRPIFLPIQSMSIKKKQVVLEIFQQKAREIFSPHIFVYGEDTLRFEADGSLKGIDGFSYYEIDQSNHRLDYNLIYFKNTPTFFADLEDKSNTNFLAFILTKEKLDFYLIDEQKKEPIDHLISYQILKPDPTP